VRKEIFLIYGIFTPILHYYKLKSEIFQIPKSSRYFKKTEVDNPKSRIIHFSEIGRLFLGNFNFGDLILDLPKI